MGRAESAGSGGRQALLQVRFGRILIAFPFEVGLLILHVTCCTCMDVEVPSRIGALKFVIILDGVHRRAQC